MSGKIFAVTTLKCEYSETNSSGARQHRHFINIDNIDAVSGVKIPGQANTGVISNVDTSSGKFTVKVEYKAQDGNLIRSEKSSESIVAGQEISSAIQVEDTIYQLTCALN